LKSKICDQSTSKTKISQISEWGNSILADIPEQMVMNFYSRAKKNEDYFWEKEGLRPRIEPFIIRIEDDSESEWESESEEEVEYEGSDDDDDSSEDNEEEGAHFTLF
jgi:hypothetical protein